MRQELGSPPLSAILQLGHKRKEVGDNGCLSLGTHSCQLQQHALLIRAGCGGQHTSAVETDRWMQTGASGQASQLSLLSEL